MSFSPTYKQELLLHTHASVKGFSDWMKQSKEIYHSHGPTCPCASGECTRSRILMHHLHLKKQFKTRDLNEILYQYRLETRLKRSHASYVRKQQTPPLLKTKDVVSKEKRKQSMCLGILTESDTDMEMDTEVDTPYTQRDRKRFKTRPS